MMIQLPMMSESFDDRIGYPSFIPEAPRVPRKSGTTKERDPSTIGRVTPAPEFNYLNDQWTIHLGLENNYKPSLLKQLFGTYHPPNPDRGLGQRAVQP